MPRLPRRPRTKRGLLAAIVGSAAVAFVALCAVIYFVMFPTSSPKPFHLAAPKRSAPVSAATNLSGHWTVAKGSQAGYRVREKLAFLPAESDAVGRTSAISGGATFVEAHGGVSATAASFVTDVLDLKSNEPMRDQHIQTIGIQSATYPKATFVLTKALVLPADALSGAVVDTSVTGDLAMHGSTKLVTIPTQIRLSSSEIHAVGSLTFPWGEFGMTAPSVGGFVSVTANATMEFDLVLARG
jgi:polyisoprenoid-binding protein YceI